MDTTGKKRNEESKSKSNLLQELLENENLSYNLPSAATVVVEKNSKIFFMDKTAYTSGDGEMVITLNSGSDFIDGMNSYLAFKVAVTGSAGTPTADFITWGDGSASNLFSEIVIRSRDGAEIERIRDLNSLMLTKCRWTNAQDFINNKASESGYLPEYGSSDDGKTATVTGRDSGMYSKQEITAQLLASGTTAGTNYVIPMRDLSALFNVEKLLPSFLMSGLRITFVLAPVVSAFHLEGAAAASDYTITEPILRLETLKLSDSVMNQLTQNAANGGLVLPIDTWDLTRDTVTGTQANIEVRRNVSQVLGVVVKTRLTADVTEANADSLASAKEFKVAGYRFRLGSQFIPNSKVTKAVECYSLAQIAFNKYKQNSAENSVSLKDYLENGRAVIASDLERSAIDLSGVSISNSKVLAWEANYAVGTPRTVNVWIQFTRALTVFLTNTLVQD
tara:strand:+ start:4038 stop:5384 length:1347 start_codon:yes stop_codon:yes gene_type:complete